VHPDHPGLNVGALIHDGAGLTTHEVLALIHEVCVCAGTAFPQAPENLWIATTGELLITQPDQLAAPMDPRTAVASLLEKMLPEGDRDPERTIPESLRSLPARLRAASGGRGLQDRADLMWILSWHLGQDPRQVIQQLMQRVTHRGAEAAAAAAGNEAAAAAPSNIIIPGPSNVHDDLDLYGDHVDAPWMPAPVEPPRRAVRRPLRGILPALAVAALFVAIGSASYWLVRDQAAFQRVATDGREAPGVAPAEHIAPPPPTATDAAPLEANPTGSAGATDAAAQPLQLSVTDGAFSPTFAASGRELFFHAGRSSAGRLLVASLDDSGRVSRVSALFDDRARNYHARVSPDGRLLAFDSDRGGTRAVYVSDRDGSNPQRVSGSGYGAVPSWSPDMKWLAFVRGEEARPQVWNLWLRDLSTGAMHRHTSFRSGQVWGASWFPDGRSLCYSHEDQLVISQLEPRQDIVMDTPRRGHLVRTPAVSPDGLRIVFQVFQDGGWLVHVQSGQVRRILDDPTAEEFSWAPDGRRIAYHSRRDGAWRIWVMHVPG
jgi:WD40-like Beta Propeller Repeat